MSIDNDWEMIPYAEQSTFGRFLYRVVGEKRLERWARKIDAPTPRCPWTAPVTGDQCVLREGHKRTCKTVVTHTNVRTGKVTREPRWWWGINYSSR